jgi:hypothetical protein
MFSKAVRKATDPVNLSKATKKCDQILTEVTGSPSPQPKRKK